MNTQIYLWIEPMIMHHERCTDKVYFNCIVEGDYSACDTIELENLIEGKKMSDIMEFADISSNWNYSVVSSTLTTKKPIIEYAYSPEKIAKEKEDKLIAQAKKKEKVRVTRILNSKKPLSLIKENVEIKDDGKIEVNFPEFNVNQSIDFLKIWTSLEKEVIGKIQEGDVATFTDHSGNILFEITGGSFLNVGLADLSVYDKKITDKFKNSLFIDRGLKGGLFVRKDGSMDVGDAKRTFWLKIYTNNLLKTSLKVNKKINELFEIKSLTFNKKNKSKEK